MFEVTFERQIILGQSVTKQSNIENTNVKIGFEF